MSEEIYDDIDFTSLKEPGPWNYDEPEPGYLEPSEPQPVKCAPQYINPSPGYSGSYQPSCAINIS